MPKVTLSFLEFFPHARAHYEGMRRSGCGAINIAMQHAGVCREKTFYYLHPKIEYEGLPDGCRVPAPDRVIAMGTLAAEIFRESGFANERVILAGSARYDHVRFSFSDIRPRAARPREGLRHVLLVCSLELEVEIQMVEAVCLALRRLDGFVARVRSHPFARVDSHPRFASQRDAVEISDGTLDSDIAWADVVVFSYSTVADEAWLQGVPAWQWLPLAFNGSALVEALAVPRFGTIDALREAFRKFAVDSEKFVPTAEQRELAARRLFFPADGKAAERIVSECMTHAPTACG
jgi:surface carbohydrate biosynthesis protein (TIGR04326 family)